MRLAGNIVSTVLALLGLLWAAQGSNMMPNTMMSGQSQWLYIGIAILIVGLVGLWWFNFRRR